MHKLSREKGGGKGLRERGKKLGEVDSPSLFSAP